MLEPNFRADPMLLWNTISTSIINLIKCQNYDHPSEWNDSSFIPKCFSQRSWHEWKYVSKWEDEKLKTLTAFCRVQQKKGTRSHTKPHVTIKRRSIKWKPIYWYHILCHPSPSTSCKALASATSSEMVEKASIYEDHMNQCM